MKTFFNIVRRAAVAAAVLTLAGSGNHALWARGPQPHDTNTIRVPGATGRIDIRRDRDGVPTIRARSEEDALFGLGYVHAQDRLWQMEFQRRIGNGRLAELLGPNALPTDALFRTVGLARTAAATFAALTPEERSPFETYVAGVNAYLQDKANRKLSPEFGILHVDPEPWRPEDVLAWIGVVLWGQSGNWDKELLGAQIAAKLGPDAAARLMPAYTPDGPTILPSASGIAKAPRRPARPRAGRPAASTPLTLDSAIADGLIAVNREIEARTGIGAEGFGSNSWVVAGSRTTTGKPILANDPHLDTQTPGTWYLARVTGGRLDAAGATIPGIPGVIIGHNDRIAWGITTLNVDSQDFFVEHVNDRDEAEFMGAFEPLTIVPETIKVAGAADVNLKVRISRHGPLVSDVIAPTGQPLALRWTGNDAVESAVLATLGIDRARDWDEFRAALGAHRAPDENYIYADRRGHIGYVAPGTIPVRAKGDGRFPVPGWTGEFEWTGYVPFDELPTLIDPPQGYIVTANNKVGDAYPHLVGTAFAPPYRAARIVEMIESEPRLSPVDMEHMQGDVFAFHARKLLAFMQKTTATDERSRRALELLGTWDTRAQGGSAGAAVFEAWYAALGERLFADELGDGLWAPYSENIYMVAMAIEAAIENDDPFCDDVRTPEIETRADVLASALADGLARMAGVQGTDDVAAWRWDKAHVALFPHQPFGANPDLAPLFSRSVPNGGDKFTVNVASDFHWPSYDQRHAAQFRQIVDLRDPDAARFVVAPGQSGDRESPHYDDLLERWRRVEYLIMKRRAGRATSAADAPDDLPLLDQ